ncbi:MAG: ATP-binding protein [Pseudomonadota bacterium]
MREHELQAAALRRHTRQALAGVARRLAASLEARFGDAAAHGPELAAALEFARRYGEALPPAATVPGHPLTRLARLADTPTDAALLRDLLLLTCLPREHEGFASLLRMLHPERQPLPGVALALHWLEGEQADADPFALRDRVEDLLCNSPLARLGLLRLDGDGPWHGRWLLPGPGVWEALMARPPALAEARMVSGYAEVPGLDGWLARADVRQAVAALERGLPCQIVLAGGDAGMRATRALALIGAACTGAMRTRLEPGEADSRVAAAYVAAFMHRICLWLEVEGNGPEAAAPIVEIDMDLPVIASAASDRLVPRLELPLLRLPVEALAATARRSMWQSLLPQLGEHASLLAARYPIDPDEARDVVGDLALKQDLLGEPLRLDDIADCLRARTAWHARPGVSRILPRAGWPDLLVAESARAQLEGAVRRVLQQIAVLDEWGFAQGRAERRGVRMLFYGPPGTGKTLAAEVMARALGVDLLVVDIASLVSKWIGETEKNLAAVFDLAERSRALLLFDEADALFARRTETQDAHDRYANLETAYLLQRLERYEGVAVLTTNLRGNLDHAFSRRFEFIVQFPEPDAAARLRLWRMHLPADAPCAADVDLAELAEWYALTGAQIKNATLAAAFLAAAAADAIHQRHFLLAIEREFAKAGRAHPGFPARHTPPPAAHID